MNKINIKNPLTIFTTSLKTEGVNLIVEAEEVEVIEEEEKLYFYTRVGADGDVYSFILPYDNITFRDLFLNYGVINSQYNGYYDSFDSNAQIYFNNDITNSPNNTSIFGTTSNGGGYELGFNLSVVNGSTIIKNGDVYTMMTGGGSN